LYTTTEPVFLYKLDPSTKDYTYVNQFNISLIYDQTNGSYAMNFINISTNFLDMEIPIQRDFRYAIQIHQKMSFGRFRDSQKADWSIAFSNQDLSDLFSFYLSIIMYYAKGNEEVHILDLNNPTTTPVENGDQLGIQYNAYSINAPGILGEEVDSQNLVKVLLGRAPIKGWDVGLLGMKKTGRRVIVVPPDLGYGKDPPFNKFRDTTILYLVDLLKMAKKKTETQTREEPKETSETVKILKNLSETMIPEEEDSRSNYTPPQPKQQYTQQNSLVPMNFNQPVMQQQHIQPIQPLIQPTLVPYSFPIIPPQQPPSNIYNSNTNPSNDTIQLLVDERTFKSTINNKLDLLTTKFDKLNERVMNPPQQQDTFVGGVSSKSLLHTIQRIVSENDRLTSDVETKNKRIETLTDQVNEIMEKKSINS